MTENLTNNVFSEWNEKLEVFTHICDLYDYGFHFYEDGRIAMEDRILEDSNCEWKGKNECGHLEYQSIDNMLKDWLDEIKNHEKAQDIFKNEIEFIEQEQKISRINSERKTVNENIKKKYKGPDFYGSFA